MTSDALSAAAPSNAQLADILAGEAVAASGHLAQALRPPPALMPPDRRNPPDPPTLSG